MQPIHQRKKRKKIIIYIVVIIAIIIINPFNIFGAIRSAIMVPFAPVSSMGFNIGSYFSQHTKMIFSIGSLYNKNQELRGKVAQLESQNAYLIDIKNENEELRKNLNLLPRDDFELLGAEVIMHNPAGGNQWIIINRGKRDEVEIGDAVIVGEKVFVGHVDEVEHSTARVQLSTNSQSIINVVSVRTDAQALAYGNHGTSITVEDIEKDADVTEGDIFITSEVSNQYPRGLSVGKVQSVTTAQDNLFQRANVLQLVDFDELQFVFVIR